MKTQTQQLRQFGKSTLVTNEFLAACEKDQEAIYKSPLFTAFSNKSLANLEKQVKQETIEEFEEVESRKWKDAEHCSCLKHAIWKAKGEPEEISVSEEKEEK